MKKFDGVTIILVIAAIAVTFYYVQQRPRNQLPARVEQTAAPEAAVKQPEIAHPMPTVSAGPEAEPEEPLPALDQSDEILRGKLEELATPLSAGEIFVFRNLIRNLVITVDNIPKDRLPVKYRPVLSPGGQFMVQGNSKQAMVIDPENFRRYTRYVALVEAMDSQRLVALYIHFYPLFQQAYEELGYPSKYFNDRLIEVIDHLLDTPVVEQPVRLIRPHVFYQFADPQLESLSAGQKTLIRLGYDNAEKIRAKLHELRQILTENRGDVGLP